MSRFLICGLGNPGPSYKGTRHNVGFRVVDELADRYRWTMNRREFDGKVASGRMHGNKVTLLKPQTMMNQSGKSVAEAARYYSMDSDQVVVVHDDIDLEVGRLKIKIGGGHGGHNGLRDIVSQLGDGGFTRIRVGVGRPDHPEFDVTDWVLSGFKDDEEPVIERVVDAGADAAEAIIEEGGESAQNRFNGTDYS